MARTIRFARVAAALLIVAELLDLALASPASAVRWPPVRSLRVPGWSAGSIISSGRITSGVRLLQDYLSTRTGDTASVETRCYSEPKDALKWTGRLAYLGAGFDQLSLVTIPLPRADGRPSSATPSVRAGASASEAVMRYHRQTVVIDYAYLDHWGVRAESILQWPRAIADLMTRRQGPYCMLGVAVDVSTQEQRARAEAHTLLQAFAPVLESFARD